ncbi:MAG: hypothetical protein LBT68_00245 [Spirochaetales bacterium]|nr:hypothetical protein [Spirochaetales bacterium]
MRKICLVFLTIISVVLLFSCGSAPAATEVVDLATARSRADDALAKAKSVKADVAVKPDFDKAQAAYTEAGGLEASSGDAAITKYLETEGLFLAAHDAAVTKREEARKQLDKAKSDIKAVEDEASALQKEQGGAR